MEEDHEREKDIFKEKSDMCRLCFGSTDVTVNIAQHADKSTSIIEKIHYCTSLIVRTHFNQLTVFEIIAVNCITN